MGRHLAIKSGEKNTDMLDRTERIDKADKTDITDRTDATDGTDRTGGTDCTEGMDSTDRTTQLLVHLSGAAFRNCGFSSN